MLPHEYRQITSLAGGGSALVSLFDNPPVLKSHVSTIQVCGQGHLPSSCLLHRGSVRLRWLGDDEVAWYCCCPCGSSPYGSSPYVRKYPVFQKKMTAEKSFKKNNYILRTYFLCLYRTLPSEQMPSEIQK